MNKKKILVISDDIRSLSGVATMTLRIMTHLKSKYDIVCIGASVKQGDQNPVDVNGIKLYPTEGFGNIFFLRNIMNIEKPDLIFLFTDPRFFTWLWMAEDEIRAKIPIYYMHVWDNFPIPKYNETWYKSCDFISCISSTTKQIIESFNIPCNLCLHGIDPKEYVFIDEHSREDNRKKLLGKKYYDEDAFVVLWVGRNISRKNPATIMDIFSKFQKNNPKAVLILHTDVVDENGTDLWRVYQDNFKNCNIIFSSVKNDTQYMNALYNAADVSINLSSAEGFGLPIAESLMSGTPIIVGLTGGLQDQITSHDGKFTGIGVNPSSKVLVGSLGTPYIYDDFFDQNEVLFALESMSKINKSDMLEQRKFCRKTAEDKLNIINMVEKTDEGIQYCLNNFKPRKRFNIYDTI